MNEDIFYVYVMSFFNNHFGNNLTAEQVKYIFVNKTLPNGCGQLIPKEKMTKASLCRIIVLLGLDLRTGRNIFHKDLTSHDIPKTKAAFLGDYGTKTRMMTDELLYILDTCQRPFSYFNKENIT